MKIIKYFKELLKVLKSIDKSLKKIERCVIDTPAHGHGKSIKTAHWND
jgi:hypothetical protein